MQIVNILINNSYEKEIYIANSRGDGVWDIGSSCDLSVWNRVGRAVRSCQPRRILVLIITEIVTFPKGLPTLWGRFFVVSCLGTVAAKVSAAPQNPMMLFYFEVYSPAVLNLKLLSFILFEVVLSHTFHDWKSMQKVPARGKYSRGLLCSGIAIGNILQSKPPCHLNFSFDFWVVRN